MQTTYQISNLTCWSCGQKIEDALKAEMKLKEVRVNLSAGQIVLEHEKPLGPNFIARANAITNNIENGVCLRELEPAHNQDHPHGPISPLDKILLGLAGLLFVIGLWPTQALVQLGLFLSAYLLVAKNVVVKAFKNMSQAKFFDENILMLLASGGAFLIGAYAEGAATMILYVVGEYIQDYSLYRSQESISQLMTLKPQIAHVWTDLGTRTLAPEQVAIGDILLVANGEKISLDGIVIEGNSYIDNSTLTGESKPILATVGDPVLSGGIVTGGVLKIKVTKTYSDSTLAKVLDMIVNASGRKARSEKLLSRFAGYYTPLVLVLAGLLTLVPVFLLGLDLNVWAYRSLVFLAASCPCSLLISIPLTYFAGLGKASKHGILIKGANYLEALAKIDTLIFDKTGTLTQGNFEVLEIMANTPASQDQVLAIGALAEKYSNHPIGMSIKKAYGQDLPPIPTASYREINGYGIAMDYDGHSYLCGNLALMDKHGIPAKASHLPHTMVYIGQDGQYLGSIAIADQVKPDAKTSIQALKKLNIDLQIFTGDRQEMAELIGRQVGINHIQAGLLPQDKYRQVTKLLSPKRKLAFVGDGVNDASVIKVADVGIAMGNIGSDIALESADVILSNDSLSSLVEAVKIARKTRHILIQNLVLSLGFKFLVLGLGAMGYASMWLAIFADVGIMLVASANALRAGR